MTGTDRLAEHLEAASAASGVGLVCPTTDGASATALGSAGSHPHRTVEELLGDSQIAALAVCTPLPERAYWIQAALRAGKHVLVELPAVMSRRQAREVSGAARDSGCQVVASGDAMDSEMGVEARAALSEGGGVPLYCRLRVEVPRGILAGRREGVLTLFGTPYLRLLTDGFGPLDSIYARSRSLCLNRPSADLAVAQLRFANGVEGLLEVNGLGDRSRVEFETHTTTGAILRSARPRELAANALRQAYGSLRVLLEEGTAAPSNQSTLERIQFIVDWIEQSARLDAEVYRKDVQDS
ncbi:Gfo/Idh/MocA family protein [Candidatus Latescibacterota bacterium]